MVCPLVKKNPQNSVLCLLPAPPVLSNCIMPLFWGVTGLMAKRGDVQGLREVMQSCREGFRYCLQTRGQPLFWMEMSGPFMWAQKAQRSLGFRVWRHPPRSPHTKFILSLPSSHTETDLLCVADQPFLELGDSDKSWVTTLSAILLPRNPSVGVSGN